MENKKDIGRILLKSILIFFCTCIICMGFMIITAMIPQKWIQTGSETSALYFMEHELFPCLVEGENNTKYDNYADCISFHVAYQMDDSKPFQSVIMAGYYDHPRKNVNDDYYSAVFEGKKSNTSYFRYWHGSLCILRPLLCFMGVRGIRRTLTGILVLLNIFLGIILWKKNQKQLLAIYIISLLLLKIWVVAFSVEYIMAFIVMTAITICYVICEKSSNEQFLYLSVVSGALTTYFDFLTVETITFTIPLLFLLVLKNNRKTLRTCKEEFKFILSSGMLWLFSYGGMFLIKWILSAGIMGKRAFYDVADTAGNRINSENSIFKHWFSGITYNISCLFKNREDAILPAIILAVLILIFFIKGKELSRLLLLLSLIPYLRYLIINSHSCLHYFFTYRAQLVMIMAVLIAVFQEGKRFVKVGKQ